MPCDRRQRVGADVEVSEGVPLTIQVFSMNESCACSFLFDCCGAFGRVNTECFESFLRLPYCYGIVFCRFLVWRLSFFLFYPCRTTRARARFLVFAPLHGTNDGYKVAPGLPAVHQHRSLAPNRVPSFKMPPTKSAMAVNPPTRQVCRGERERSPPDFRRRLAESALSDRVRRGGHALPPAGPGQQRGAAQGGLNHAGAFGRGRNSGTGGNKICPASCRRGGYG